MWKYSTGNYIGKKYFPPVKEHDKHGLQKQSQW